MVSGFEKIACDACGCKRDAQEAKIIAMEIESKALEASNLCSAGSIPVWLKGEHVF